MGNVARPVMALIFRAATLDLQEIELVKHVTLRIKRNVCALNGYNEVYRSASSLRLNEHVFVINIFFIYSQKSLPGIPLFGCLL